MPRRRAKAYFFQPAAWMAAFRFTSKTASCTITIIIWRYSSFTSNRRIRFRGGGKLHFEFEPTGELDLMSGKGAPGRLQLYIDGALDAETDAPYTTPLIFNPGALTCGANPGSTVVDDYEGPFRFTGTLHQVTVDLSGELIVDSEAEMRVHMARQ